MFLKRRRFFVSISPLIALVLGLTITVLLFGTVRRIEIDRKKIEFRQNANMHLLAVNQGVEEVITALQDVNQLFATVKSPSREQFRIFVQPLLERYPHIQAFNFHRLLSAAERPAYEAAMRKRFPGFSVTENRNGRMRPAGIRALHNVVDYIEPMHGNEAALGFDTRSYSFQNEAIERALETGLPSATGLLRLMQEKGGQQGVIVLVPTYRFGAVPNDAIARRNATVGDTAVVFRAGDMLAKILASRSMHAQPGIGLSVYASAAPDPTTLVYRHGEPAASHPVSTSSLSWLWYDKVDSISGPIDMAGKEWRGVVSAMPVLFLLNHKGSLYVLISGILLSMLVAAYVYLLVSRASHIELRVGERTSALQFANLRLGEDLALRDRTEKGLRLRERVIEVSANAIVITGADAPDYTIEYVNPAFERITGYSGADVVGRSLTILLGDDRDQKNIEPIHTALREKREGHALSRTHRKDGTMYWNDLYIAPVKSDSGGISHFVVAQYDITEAKRYEAELEFQATHDSLTGLANRNLLRDRLNLAIAYSDRHGDPVWVLFVDLDRFKFINDTLGHAAGDKLLKTVAQRLQATVREVDTDTVARLGGDEFMLVLGRQADEGLVLGIIDSIIAAVSQPLTIDGHEFFLTCSIGVAMCPRDGRDPDTLIKHADIAMYRAKEMGRNTYQFYTASMNERTQDRLRLEGDLRYALERDEFVLHYQPQVDLRSGRVTGMEALLRWQHPQLGLLSPDRFITLAEETGLIVPIGAWVVRTACGHVKACQQAGYGDLRVAVNFSARQFVQKDLVQSVAAVLIQTGLAPQHLEIELTESLVMTDVDYAIGVLHDFRKLGVTLSVDDFGTGYSSLSYLRRLPLNVLKIDQSFVRDITLDSDDAAIVASIISLAHSLRLHVVAEGVETKEQLAFLQRHGCDAIQGYYFSRAISAELFTQLLREQRCLPASTINSAVTNEIL
jgi:diguanylate cyclase (GGDEF)-like protein/PAS domain S-box-containing protein